MTSDAAHEKLHAFDFGPTNFWTILGKLSFSAVNKASRTTATHACFSCLKQHVVEVRCCASPATARRYPPVWAKLVELCGWGECSGALLPLETCLGQTGSQTDIFSPQAVRRRHLHMSFLESDAWKDCEATLQMHVDVVPACPGISSSWTDTVGQRGGRLLRQYRRGHVRRT